MIITLDKERLVKIRKSQKMTQAELAAKLEISLRSYSMYENLNEETSLSSLEFSRLARALKSPAHFFWGSLPSSAVLYWQQTDKYVNFSKWIAEQFFGNLKVNGLPGDPKLRDPLLKLIDTFEEVYDIDKKRKLSEKIRNRFACEDAVDELRNAVNDMPPRFYIVKIPRLRVHQDYYHDEETGKDHTWFVYDWTTQVDGLISFDTDFDPETVPLSYSYMTGKWDIFWDYDDFGDTVMTEHCKEALDARPTIEFEDNENGELRVEPVSLEGEVCEAEIQEILKKPSEKNKDDGT